MYGLVDLEQAARAALNIDSAIYGYGMFNSIRSHLHNAETRAKDIRNIGRKIIYSVKSSRDKSSKHGNFSPRQKGFVRNACVLRRKEGCMAWKRKDGKKMVDNAGVKNDAFSSSSCES